MCIVTDVNLAITTDDVGIESSRQRVVAAKQPSITVVVPTYKEVLSLPHLLDRIGKLRRDTGLDIDVLVMDDDSRDGSEEVVANQPERWAELVVRTRDRGLSPAVLDGLRRARGDVLVCMDADLSHPPEALPEMLKKLADGADFVLGSRYVRGGTTSDDWGLLRWLNSRVATWLARPLTAVQDPCRDSSPSLPRASDPVRTSIQSATRSV